MSHSGDVVDKVWSKCCGSPEIFSQSFRDAEYLGTVLTILIVIIINISVNELINISDESHSLRLLSNIIFKYG